MRRARKALTYNLACLGSTVLPCGKGSHPMDLDLANMGKGRTQSEMSIRAGIIT